MNVNHLDTILERVQRSHFMWTNLLELNPEIRIQYSLYESQPNSPVDIFDTELPPPGTNVPYSIDLRL